MLKAKLEEILQELNNPQFSLVELRRLYGEFTVMFPKDKKEQVKLSAKEIELASKIQQKNLNVFYEFVSK